MRTGTVKQTERVGIIERGTRSSEVKMQKAGLFSVNAAGSMILM